MKHHLLIINLLFFVSCTSSNQKINFSEMTAIPIQGERLEEDIISTTEAVFFIADSCFIVSDSNDPEAIITVLDERTGKRLNTISSRGSGPGEFQYPKILGKSPDNDTLYIANIPNRINLFVKKGRGNYEFAQEMKIYLKTKGEFPMDFHRMDNGYYVMTTLSGGKDFFILLDKDCREVKRFGLHPVKGMTAEACDFIVFQGRTASYGNSFYFATFKFGYIVRYDISDTGETNLVWEQYLSEPQVSVSEANIQIKGRTNLSGFHGLAANKDYLFATYSGIYYSAFIDQKDPDACTPQTLVVFKPDGQIVGKYSFSNRSTRICLSEDNSKLYLWNTLPEVGIERYNVKDILNAK